MSLLTAEFSPWIQHFQNEDLNMFSYTHNGTCNYVILITWEKEFKLMLSTTTTSEEWEKLITAVLEVEEGISSFCVRFNERWILFRKREDIDFFSGTWFFFIFSRISLISQINFFRRLYSEFNEKKNYFYLQIKNLFQQIFILKII